MRLFHELVMDVFIDGNTGFIPIFAKTHWHCVMGNLDALRFFVVADGVSGSDAALGLIVYETPDDTLKNFDILALPIDFTTLTPGQVNTFQAAIVPDDPNTIGTYAYLVAVALGGFDSPKAHVRVWVTGRGRA